MSRTEVLSWDWREQPDMEELGRIVWEKSGGRVAITSVEDTGSDQYAVVISDKPLRQVEARDVYLRWENNGRR